MNNHQAKAIDVHLLMRRSLLFLDESIDVVLCSMVIVRHLKYTRHTQQRLLSVSVAHHQQNCEVLQHTVHHVFLRQVFQLVDEVDHVFTHGRTADSVDKPSVFKPGVLRLNFLDHLLAKGADLCGAGDGHVL